MSLTVLQMRLRENHITGSFLPKLMADDEAEILNEWRRLVGDPEYVEEDLSNSWPVQFGSYIEEFALSWHERKTGQLLTRRGEVVYHPERPYVCATLDAFRAADSTVIDCKAPGQWRKLDDVLAAYVSQLVCQRACVGAERASLLVVHGGSEPVEYPLDIQPDYEAVVWERVDAFWHCVETLTPPVALQPVVPPPPPETWRAYDLDAMIAGGALEANWMGAIQPPMGVWAETAPYAKRNADAVKTIKELLPEDASSVAYAGVKITRARNGAVTVKEAKK